ncbi:MAG: hypothetical protein GY782_03345 [Gammaproteobacteria bacterium]|nr:hypothetical protein [Gammaproteobacteria bacterium]
MKVNYADGRGDKQHVIFDTKGQPLYVCRKDEVEGLFDSTFRMIYEAWQYYNNGFGLPNGGSWSEYDPDFINCILEMEMYYKRNFSVENVVIQYLEALIKKR